MCHSPPSYKHTDVSVFTSRVWGFLNCGYCPGCLWPLVLSVDDFPDVMPKAFLKEHMYSWHMVHDCLAHRNKIMKMNCVPSKSNNRHSEEQLKWNLHWYRSGKITLWDETEFQWNNSMLLRKCWQWKVNNSREMFRRMFSSNSFVFAFYFPAKTIANG